MTITGAVFPAGREEALKADFFRDTATGFFVDGGADAPQDGSQSFALERRGWSGVLVEPQPDFAGQLRRERRARVYAVACTAISSPAAIAGSGAPGSTAGTSRRTRRSAST